MMGFELSIRSIIFLIGFPFSLMYLYSLFNLYIGKNVKKYRMFLISFNFLLLVGYIVLLVTIPEYNQVPLIILLLVLLGMIVLGLIGGFMFNPDYAVDKSDRYKKQVNIFGKFVKSMLILVGTIITGIVSYNLLTHEVQRPSLVNYVLDYQSDENICDAHILIDMEDDAEFFFTCDVEQSMLNNMISIRILFDDLEIYNNDDIDSVMVVEEGMIYQFKLNFGDMKNLVSEMETVTVEITKENETLIYEFNIYNSIIDYVEVRVPIWIRE